MSVAVLSLHAFLATWTLPGLIFSAGTNPQIFPFVAFTFINNLLFFNLNIFFRRFFFFFKALFFFYNFIFHVCFLASSHVSVLIGLLQDLQTMRTFKHLWSN